MQSPSYPMKMQELDQVMQPTTAPVSRRRNGKQQACEPCRRRKVACNHEYPVCNRCKMRGEAASCIYLAKSFETTAHQTSKRLRQGASNLESVRQGHDNFLSDGSNNDDNLNRDENNNEVLSGGQGDDDVLNGYHSDSDILNKAQSNDKFFKSGHTDNNRKGHGPSSLGDASSSGYMGLTSVSAVLQETQQIILPALTFSPEVQYTSSTSTSGASRRFLSNYQIQQGIDIIRQLPSNMETVLNIFNRITSPNDCWSRVAARRLIIITWRMFGEYLSDHSDVSRLQSFAKLIFHNTDLPLPESETFKSPADWLETFSGRNTRWESLAIIFVYLALGTLASLVPGGEEKKLLIVYKECCSSCISLANSRGNANTLLVYAIYKRSTIEAYIHGDASLTYWKDHAEAVAMLTFLGLHVGANSGSAPYQPSILSEIRRRIFHQIYIMDKVLATFVGRPPLLGWKYCSTPLPLDLDDRVLLSSEGYAEQETEINNFDDQNTQAYPRANTIIRARSNIALIREEILDAALGQSKDFPAEKIMQLKTRELEVYSQLPSEVVYLCSQDIRQFSPSLLYTKLLIRLEHLMNLFLLGRLHTWQGEGRNSDLLSISFEMVELALVFWKYKDRLAGFQGEFEWLVIGHGAPAAGILCNELVFSNSAPAKVNIGDQTSVPLSRSLIIQQLSVLVSFLDWVGPTQPNSDLAKTVKSTIVQVLDQVLNNSTASSTVDFDFDIGTDELSSFDLLNTFDWFRENSGGTNRIA